VPPATPPAASRRATLPRTDFFWNVFEPTPFGAYCKLCSVDTKAISVGISKNALGNHITKHHGNITTRPSAQFQSAIAKEHTDLILSDDLESYVSAESRTGYVCWECGFASPQNYKMNRHYMGRNACNAVNKKANATLRLSRCGRWVSLLYAKKAAQVLQDNRKETELEEMEKLMGKAPPIDFEEIWDALDDIVDDDEDKGDDVDAYAPLFANMLHASENVPETLAEFVRMYSAPPGDDEPDLLEAHRLAKEWVENDMTGQVRKTPGNLRAALMVFDGQSVGEQSQNFTYNVRHNVNNLLPDLKALLNFAYRRGAPVSDKIRELLADSNDNYKIEKALKLLYTETISCLREDPVAYEYCLSRVYRSVDGKLRMNSCNQVGKHAAAVMSLLRAAICGYLNLFQADALGTQFMTFAMETVQSARSAPAGNQICPLIRTTKEIDAKKPLGRIVSVSEDETINVDEFRFPKAKWSTIISRVANKIEGLLTKILEGSEWMRFIDCSVPVTCVRNEQHRFLAEIEDERGQPIKLHDHGVLKFKNNHVDEEDMVCLRAYFSFAFHGFGVGAGREVEVKRLLLKYAQWHNGTIYYGRRTLKTFAFWDKKGRLVIHKLPLGIARLWLVYRQLEYQICESGVIDDPVEKIGVRDYLIPGRKFTQGVGRAAAELFSLRQLPSAIQVRHECSHFCHCSSF